MSTPELKEPGKFWQLENKGELSIRCKLLLELNMISILTLVVKKFAESNSTSKEIS